MLSGQTCDCLFSMHKQLPNFYFSKSRTNAVFTVFELFFISLSEYSQKKQIPRQTVATKRKEMCNNIACLKAVFELE